MREISELEQFLREQTSAGQLESAGKFTLDRQHALKKLAAFQLPRPGAWVLKVVQSVVRGGGQALAVRQTHNETLFDFEPTEVWTADLVEAAFFDPGVTRQPGLDALKRGLWPLALAQKRPFRLTFPSQFVLVWTGERFHRAPLPANPGPKLTVAHQPFNTRGTSPVRGNAEVLRELASHANVCPIPLRVDGRVLNAIGLPPTLRSGSTHLPLLTGTHHRRTPTWKLSSSSTIQLPGMGTETACLLAAHASRRRQGMHWEWRGEPNPSRVFWIRDGVVVDSQTLPIPPLSVTCSVFTSAADLPTDASGLTLVKVPAREGLLRQACQSIIDFVHTPDLISNSLFHLNEMASGSHAVVGLAMVAGGAGISVLNPLGGLSVMGAGLLHCCRKEDTRTLVKSLETDLSRLRQHWNKLYGWTVNQ